MRIALLTSLAWMALTPSCLADSFLIQHAHVFDGEQMLGVRDVLVASGKIVDVAAKLSPPPGVVLIDATGLSLLPGLFDSHAHIGDGGYSLRCAALFGVTTVIDLGTVGVSNTPREIHERVRTRAPGESADFLSAGLYVTTEGSHGTEFGTKVPTLGDPSDAQAFVDARIAEGSDLIKVIYEDFGGKLPRMSRKSMEAVIRAAHIRSKLAVVHAGEGPEAIRTALDAGADGIAHTFVTEWPRRILAPCSFRTEHFSSPR